MIFPTITPQASLSDFVVRLDELEALGKQVKEVDRHTDRHTKRGNEWVERQRKRDREWEREKNTKGEWERGGRGDKIKIERGIEIEIVK